ncbi:MAG: SRPBCC domain-containing protein [Planctomycetota bacterium]
MTTIKRLAPVRGIVVQSVTRIHAPPARVWRALTQETRKWWPKGMTVNPKARGVTIESRLGGRFFEDWGGGNGLTWWTVIGLRKGGWLELSGALEAEMGGPGVTLARILLRANGKDTDLHLVDNLWGPIPRGEEKNIARGWDALARELKAYVEKRGKR